MEANDLIRELRHKHGDTVILDAMLKVSEAKCRPFPEWMSKGVDVYLAHSQAVKNLEAVKISIGERDTKIGVPTKGHMVSLASLRFALFISPEEFRALATDLVTAAWFEGIQLKTLHYLVKTRMAKHALGEIKRGMLIKIIFSNSAFTYDRSEGPAFVRRRHANRMTLAHCIQRAELKFKMVNAEIENVIKSQNKKELPTLAGLV